jgi:hypothetical protein
MVLMDEDYEALELAIGATSTEDLLRIVGIDRPRYGETLVTAAAAELKRRGLITDERDETREG